MLSAALLQEEVPPHKDNRQETRIGRGQRSQGPYRMRRRMGTTGKGQDSAWQSPKGNGLPSHSQGQTERPKDNMNQKQYSSDQAASPPGQQLVSGAPRQPHFTPQMASQSSQICSNRQSKGSRRKQSPQEESVLCRGINPPATLGGILLSHAFLTGPVLKSHVSSQGQDRHGHSISTVSNRQITNPRRSAISKQANRKGPRFKSEEARLELAEHKALPDHIQLFQSSDRQCLHRTLTGTDLPKYKKQGSLDVCYEATPTPNRQNNNTGVDSDHHGQVIQEDPVMQRGRRRRNRHQRQQQQREYNTQRASDLSRQVTLSGKGARAPLTKRGLYLKQTRMRDSRRFSSSEPRSNHDAQGPAIQADPDSIRQNTLSGSILRSSASASGSDAYGPDLQDCPDGHQQFPIRENSEVSHQAVPSCPNLRDSSTQLDHSTPGQVNTQGSKLHRSMSGSYDNVLCYTCQDRNQTMLPGHVGQSSAYDYAFNIPEKECQNDPNHHSCTICVTSALLGCVSLDEGSDHCQQQGQNYQLCPTRETSDHSLHATLASCDVQDPHVLCDRDLLQQVTQKGHVVPSSASRSQQDMYYQRARAGPAPYSPAILAGHVHENRALECGSDLYDQVFKLCTDGYQHPIWGSSDLHQSSTPLRLNPWEISPRAARDFPSLDTQKSRAAASCADVSLTTTQAEPDLCNQDQLPVSSLSSTVSAALTHILECVTLAGLDFKNCSTLRDPTLGSSVPASLADMQVVVGHADHRNWASVAGPTLQSRASNSTSDHNISSTQAKPDQHCYTVAGPNPWGFAPGSDLCKPFTPPGPVYSSNSSLEGHNFPGPITYAGRESRNWGNKPGQGLESNRSGFQHDGFHGNIPVDSDGSIWAPLPGHILPSHASESYPDAQMQAALAKLRHPTWANLPCSVLWDSPSDTRNIWGQANQDDPHLPTLPGPFLPSSASVDQRDVPGHSAQAGLTLQTRATLSDKLLCNGASRSTIDVRSPTFQADSDQQLGHAMADLEFQFANSPSLGAETLNMGTPSRPLFSRKASMSIHYLHDLITCSDQATFSRASTPDHILPNRGMGTDPTCYLGLP
ncbi:uncharacterized protein RHO17_004232 [Thomomys bottae]